MQRTLIVRVNGVLPTNSSQGACTSCSVVENEEGSSFGKSGSDGFHLLVDAGPGVSASLNQGASELHLHRTSPNAILITHAHREQYNDLETIASGDSTLKVYCTKECSEQILKDFPSLAPRISTIKPSEAFNVGPFSIIPVSADHTSESGGPAGSVIYVIKYEDKKIICGWDFLSLPDIDANLVWNPDLLIVGTDTYNDHPSTGLISVSDAYNLIRRWNAKETFIVRYSGQKDSEDARNQWFRGPTKPLSLDELQTIIDEHLRVSGAEGKYSVTVARQGTIWKPRQVVGDVHEEPISNHIELEAIEKYVLKFSKREDGTLEATIEDSINRQQMEFSNAKVSEDGRRLDAEPIKGFMMRGPELSLSIALGDDQSIVKVNVSKGKKIVLSDDMRFSKRDAQRLIRYLNHNFAANQKVTASV